MTGNVCAYNKRPAFIIPYFFYVYKYSVYFVKNLTRFHILRIFISAVCIQALGGISSVGQRLCHFVTPPLARGDRLIIF